MKPAYHGVLALGLVLQFAGAAVAAAEFTNIQILSATVRNQKIAGASVTLQKNGEQSITVGTDAQGWAVLQDEQAADPAALLIVRRAGYSDLVAKCPCAGMAYAMSPVMTNLDGLRIVLNWGAEPRDLDGHLAFPGNHVAFSHLRGDDAQLDVDHMDGFGPETITIARKHPGERYVYAVHDFWDKDDPNTAGLSASNAKVFVYIGQTLIRTYYVPQGRQGNIWTVFAISEEGELQDINAMSGASASSLAEVTSEMIFGSTLGNHEVVAAVTPTPPVDTTPSSAVPESAHKLNTQGEAAYRAGDYAGAIRLFQDAIALDETYGQAYSNLGLVFQKSGRVAEALYANRKAIALAHGANAATTRASTHFNNGRIYEDAGQWSDALREYQAAQQEKSNSTYASAIARLQEHGAAQ